MFSKGSNENSTPRPTPSRDKPTKSFLGHTPRKGAGHIAGQRRAEKPKTDHGTTRIKSFDLDAVLKYVGRARQRIFADGKLYNVAMNNQRMKLIGRTQKCACCGAKGKFFWLEQSGGGPPHFNLYAEDHAGRNVLLVMDHIQREPEGGKTEPGNLQLLCVPCHRKKANRSISNEELLAERSAEDESLRHFIEERQART